MDDRKLLESAAAAAGIEIATWSNCQPGGFVKGCSGVFWNPLTNDGDALRLSVQLELLGRACFHAIRAEELRAGNDRYTATRRAIVRTAAAMTPNDSHNRTPDQGVPG